jgi:beta-mannosidase
MNAGQLDLTGKWQFMEYPASARRCEDLENGNWMGAEVPSSVFTALIEASQIQKKDLTANPERYYWVSQKPWIFRKDFELPEDFIRAERLELVFDGLDTVATVWCNEKLIAKTDNMFIQQRFDVTDLLRVGRNRVMVKFDSAEKFCRDLM